MKTLVQISMVLLALVITSCATQEFSKRKYTKGRFYHKSNYKSLKGDSNKKKETSPQQKPDFRLDTISLSIKKYVYKDSELTKGNIESGNQKEKFEAKHKSAKESKRGLALKNKEPISKRAQVPSKEVKTELEEVKEKEPRVKNATKKAFWALIFALLGASTGLFFPPLLFFFIGFSLFFVYKSLMAKDRNTFSVILVIVTVSLCTLLVFFGVFYTRLWLLTVTGNVHFF